MDSKDYLIIAAISIAAIIAIILVFVLIVKVNSLLSKGIDKAMGREPEVVETAQDNGYSGYEGVHIIICMLIIIICMIARIMLLTHYHELYM
jgi:hypothetical protein